ncbi:PKD domain-containing protein [Patulibacter sp. NPDC049589]|uniref:PKD domain-containing protein n=1 Tax=Patulibacter sp. NPDC049589 TaxID=3154731 RepID=UPI00344323BE
MAPAPSGAVIQPATTIAGPDTSILSVDGVAMAGDGTGGVVFRKLVDGVPHVFVSRFLRDHWAEPQRVDVDRPFTATMPTIAAAEGGRLLVVWATPVRTVGTEVRYNLVSSFLGEGATGFGPTIEVDGNDIGDGTAAFPSLAMSDNGNAYVAYRVVTNDLLLSGINVARPMRPGDQLVDVRVARFNGLTWSSVGTVNRVKGGSITMRKPTAENAPAVAADATNGGIVTWQEPGIDGVARIWSRRLFNRSPGVVLPVSGDTLDGKPVTVDADAPAVAINRIDGAQVAYRLAGGTGSPLGTPYVLRAGLPSSDQSGTAFAAPSPIEGGAGLGVPDVAIDATGGYRVTYVLGGQARTVGGADTGPIGPPAALGASTGRQVPQSINPDGGGVTAWPSVDDAGRPVTAVRQVFPGGAWQQATLSSPISGPVTDVRVGSSPLGDGLIAALQGPTDGPRIMGSLADSPPGAFSAFKPETAPDWVRRNRARLAWDAAPKAGLGVYYDLAVDGTKVLTRQYRTSARLPYRGLGDGVHQVQVIAVDRNGQQTASAPAELQVDTNAPTLTATRASGRRLRVRIADRFSGVTRDSTRVSFGDGTAEVRKRTSIVHRYKKPGRYRVTARVRDEAGNLINRRTKVTIR